MKPLTSLEKLKFVDKAELSKCLCSCVSALVWADRLLNPKQISSDYITAYDPRPQCASGFLVHTKNVTWWVTAGHIVADLNECERAGRKMVATRLMHQWDDDKANDDCEAIPFAFDSVPRYHAFDESAGVDIGAVPIPQHAARLLIKSGVTPIRRSLWARKNDTFDLYAITGFPKSQRTLKALRSHTSDMSIHAALGCPVLFAESCEALPHMKTPFPLIHGRILSLKGFVNGKPVELDSIDGMSGGPVWGLRFTEDSLEWRLVGVQSSWHKKTWTVSVYPIKQAMTVIARRLESAMASA